MGNNLGHILREELDLASSEVIDETTLNRLLNTHYENGFIIISANRAENTHELNNRQYNSLKNDVVYAGYSYFPVYGGFVETDAETGQRKEVKEPSLVIANAKAGTHKFLDDTEGLKELGMELAHRYNQEAFLFKPKDGTRKAYYLDANGNIQMSFNDKSVNDLAQIYFTQFKKNRNSTATRQITFTEQLFLNKSPLGLQEAINRYGEHFFG